jgi:hypothetical protein
LAPLLLLIGTALALPSLLQLLLPAGSAGNRASCMATLALRCGCRSTMRHGQRLLNGLPELCVFIVRQPVHA